MMNRMLFSWLHRNAHPSIKIYLSHSIPEDHKELLPKLAAFAKECRAQILVGTRPWFPPQDLPNDVAARIDEADCYVAWMLKEGPYLYYANQEGLYMRGRCSQKPGILLVARDVLPPVSLQFLPQIPLGRDSLTNALEKAGRLAETDSFKGKLNTEQMRCLSDFLRKGISLTVEAASTGQAVEASDGIQS